MRNTAYPALILTVGLLASIAARCSQERHWGVAEAERCGKVHFPSPPKVISLRGGSGFQDTSVDLVAEVPSSELPQFTKDSKLPGFSPGIPQDWVKLYWEHTDFAADVLKADPTDTWHVEVDHGSTDARKIAVIGVNRPQSRLYLMLMC